MKEYYLTIICFIAVLTFCAAHAQEADKQYWHPNIDILDEAAKYSDPPMMDAAKTLTRDLTNFYQLLRDKQWHETYQLHSKAFQEDVLESDYLREAKKTVKNWELVDYDVLSANFSNTIGSTNIDEVMLICKFIELPGSKASYSTVFWHKEDGVWKCLSAGPHTLGIFRETRPPIIDWR